MQRSQAFIRNALKTKNLAKFTTRYFSLGTLNSSIYEPSLRNIAAPSISEACYMQSKLPNIQSRHSLALTGFNIFFGDKPSNTKHRLDCQTKRVIKGFEILLEAKPLYIRHRLDFSPFISDVESIIETWSERNSVIDVESKVEDQF